MKKQSILFLAIMVAMLTMVSCKKNQAKDTKLENESDSLNYSLGIANGDAIKTYYMQDVANEDAAIAAFLDAFEKSYNSEEETNELYELGLQVGGSFKQQEKGGLMGEPDLKFDYDLVKQGFLNGINETEGGMTAIEAQQYIQTVMMQFQQEKMNALQQQNTSEDIIIEEITE